MLKFGAMGREIDVPLFTDPKPELNGQGPDAYAVELAEWTAQQDVKIRIKLVGRSAFRSWAYEYDRLQASGRARLLELRKQTPAEVSPQLHNDNYVDEETASETDALMRKVLSEAAVQLKGIEVDALEASAYLDPGRIPDVLDHAGLLGTAFFAVLKAQNPDRKDSFS